MGRAISSCAPRKARSTKMASTGPSPMCVTQTTSAGREYKVRSWV